MRLISYRLSINVIYFNYINKYYSYAKIVVRYVQLIKNLTFILLLINCIEEKSKNSKGCDWEE
jgi:hypothetical protein